MFINSTINFEGKLPNKIKREIKPKQMITTGLVALGALLTNLVNATKNIFTSKTNINNKLNTEVASVEDLKAIHKIELEIFNSSYEISSDFETYKAELELEEVSTYAIKSDNGEVIGYYQLEPVENGELYIHSMAVRSDLQKTKTSYAAIKQIQEDITKFAQENNVKTVTLDVDVNKPELVKLYKKFGFQIVNKISMHHGEHVHCDYRMKVELHNNEDFTVAKSLDLEESNTQCIQEEHSEELANFRKTIKELYPEAMDMYKNVDIKNLVSLYEKDPDIVIKLLKEARCDSDEKFPRFSPPEILEIITLYKKYPQLMERLLSETKLNFKNEDIFRFEYDDILDVVFAYDRNPKLVEKLLDYKTPPSVIESYINVFLEEADRVAPRFKAAEIKELVLNYDKNPDLIDLFIEDTLLKASDIIDCTSFLYNVNPTLAMRLAKETCFDEDLNLAPRYTAEDIQDIIILYQEIPDFVNKLITETVLLDDKFHYPKYEGDEIAPICESYIKNPRIVERLLEETYFDKFEITKLDLIKFFEMLPTIEDYEVVKNVIDYFCKNIDLLQHHDMEVTESKLLNLIFHEVSVSTIFNIIDLIGDTALCHASELKYRGLEQFLGAARSLSFLNENTKNILKSKLEQLPHPEQKLSKLEVITALWKNLKEDAILEIANKISNPKMTIKQKELVNELFFTNKPYEEQIKDFIKAFNVPKERESQIRKFLLEQKLNKKYVTPQSAKEQIAIIDKKIQSIISNDKIPADKKQAYLKQLEQQKANIIAHPEEFTKSRINERAMKPLEAQVEAHINLPNQNKEFTKTINEQIYKILKIDITEDLLTAISYDSKYISKIFGGVSDKGFKNNFNELIELIKANPNKKFTDIIRNLPHNIETKELFEANGLDFERWITFDATSKHPFTINVDVEKAVRTARVNLKNELNSELAMRLDQNEIAKLLQILEDNNIDTASQKDLPKIIKLIEKELEINEYWYENSPDIKTFKDHIQIHKKNIHDVEHLKDITEELYVRLWDNDDIGRNIFFGNHVGCCTSIGSFNAFAAPQHLMNAFVNGIEIVGKYGNSMGNSMCYFAKVDGQLTFIIDSFEANGKLGAAPEVTDAIIAYAKKVCAEMGQPNANIMFGPNYNKIDFTRCIKTEGHKIEIIGNAPIETYIDAIGGLEEINQKVYLEKSMFEVMDL